jgi:hypothetical protein
MMVEENCLLAPAVFRGGPVGRIRVPLEAALALQRSPV